ncbi:MAG: Crp/Fnr family transcriptional regulator [Cyanobacteria bacterium J06642_2]
MASSILSVNQVQEWGEVCQWAEQHFHSRTFSRDEQIPTRPGLVYITQEGVVRLVSITPERREVFVGFVVSGTPFEVVDQDRFQVQAYSHTDYTTVMWFYWKDLQQWPRLYERVQSVFRQQLQRKLLWLGNLGQRRAIDRLKGFLSLLIEEYGEPCPEGVVLPWTLTHSQIGDAIGATRVTVTRSLGTLRSKGFVKVLDQNQLCLPGGASLLKKNAEDYSYSSALNLVQGTR